MQDERGRGDVALPRYNSSTSTVRPAQSDDQLRASNRIGLGVVCILTPGHTAAFKVSLRSVKQAPSTARWEGSGGSCEWADGPGS